MIEFWVGVDGGGTHTRARIRDRAGKLLGEGRAAGSNLELGIPFAHGNVLTAIASARQAAGLDQECEQQMGVGLALASAELADCYHALLAMPFPFARLRLTSDAFGACLGAFGGEEGAILIAGTGSAGSLIPPHEYHTIRNASDTHVAVSLHIYERAMTCCGIFQPAADGWHQYVSKQLKLDEAA